MVEQMITNIFKNLFANFVNARRLTRHFHRLSLFDNNSTSLVVKEVSSELTNRLLLVAQQNPEILLNDLNTKMTGLDQEQADLIRQSVGLNDIHHEKPLHWWQHLWLCYKSPFNLLLSLLAGISCGTQDTKATIVITSMVVVSVSIRFWQESKSNNAADQLKALVTNTATVMRHCLSKNTETVNIGTEEKDTLNAKLNNPCKVEIPITQLVPGDIVILSAGDMIPADCRVLTAKDLFVSQSAMTGESLPMEKFINLNQFINSNPLECENLVFMGTNVVSGSSTAVVINTGDRTYFGSLVKHVTSNNVTTTHFQEGVNKVAWVLIRFMLVMIPLVFFINGFTKGTWGEAFLFAMSIAVGLTPEMLPMIVTSTLAKGAVVLSKQKVIVKRLDAIQNFGAMNVLCTDKTGTLTQNKIFLKTHTNIWNQESDEVLEFAYLNSYYQTGLKNLLDVAILEHVDVHMELNPSINFSKIDEIPFDFQRRRMSVIVADKYGQRTLICKGALEEMLDVCTSVRNNESIDTLSIDLLNQIREVTTNLNEDGLRVVAVAIKQYPAECNTFSVKDEVDLTLIGYVAFLDPPKESAKPALQALAEHGISVKVLTGDNKLVTAKICLEVGLDVNKILLGSDVETMNDLQLSEELKTCNIFAKLNPFHKDRIVRVLKQAGNVVGFMGDGINDAPALRTADIGISVDSAVDIAKEAADIIMLEKSLMVLVQGVIEGRRTFANILKYIKMTASSNFGNVLSVLLASAFIPFLPMLPMQLLIQNLLYDFSQIAIPFDLVDPELVQKPQCWNPTDIGRFMLYFGPISSIFDIMTFYIMWYIFKANSIDNQTIFQSGWFIEGLMTQTLIVHMIRTKKIPFIQSQPGTMLLVSTTIIMAIGIYLPMGFLANYFKFSSLPDSYFSILVLLLLAYIALTQLMKGYYSKKFGWQ